MDSIHSKELERKVANYYDLTSIEASQLIDKADDEIAQDFLGVLDDVKIILNENEEIFNKIAWAYIDSVFNDYDPKMFDLNMKIQQRNKHLPLY